MQTYWVRCVTRIDFPCNHRVWNHPVYQNTNKLILPATHGPFRFHLLPLHEPCLHEVTVRFTSHCYRLYNCSTWWTIEPDRFEAIPVVNRNGGLQTTTNRSVAYRNPCLTFSHVLTILHDGKTCRNPCVATLILKVYVGLGKKLRAPDSWGPPPRIEYSIIIILVNSAITDIFCS